MSSFDCAQGIISDQGREFINSVNTELQQQLGTEHRISSTYHPQTSGLVEKLNSTIQSCLLKLCNTKQSNWDEYWESVLFAKRTSKHKSIGYTPFEVVYKRQTK